MKVVVPKQVLQYVTEDDSCPFEDWFIGLQDLMGKAIVAARIEKMRQGLDTNEKNLGAGVLESKVDHGPGYRIYFRRDGRDVVILLIGGTKHRQSRDIKNAKKYWEDYLRSKYVKTF
ncbi:MAG: type II toxin-antitoxin system RelE/ParE family toxin [Bdellovibrionota bacterium]